jgi:hypothetical protein
MNIDYLIYASIGLGCLLLLSNYIDVSYIISKLFFRDTDNNKPSYPEVKTDKEQDFLKIVSLWFQLKEQCDAFKLTIASEKLDEVFPLLNGVLDDES